MLPLVQVVRSSQVRQPVHQQEIQQQRAPTPNTNVAKETHAAETTESVDVDAINVQISTVESANPVVACASYDDPEFAFAISLVHGNLPRSVDEDNETIMLERAVETVRQPIVDSMSQWVDEARDQAHAMQALISTIQTIVKAVQKSIGFMYNPDTRTLFIFNLINVCIKFCYPSIQYAWTLAYPIARELVSMIDAYIVYKNACAAVSQMTTPEAKETSASEIATMKVSINRYKTQLQSAYQELSMVKIQRDQIQAKHQEQAGALSNCQVMLENAQHEVERVKEELAQTINALNDLGLINTSVSEAFEKTKEANEYHVRLLQKEKDARAADLITIAQLRTELDATKAELANLEQRIYTAEGLLATQVIDIAAFAGERDAKQKEIDRQRQELDHMKALAQQQQESLAKSESEAAVLQQYLLAQTALVKEMEDKYGEQRRRLDQTTEEMRARRVESQKSDRDMFKVRKQLVEAQREIEQLKSRARTESYRLESSSHDSSRQSSYRQESKRSVSRSRSTSSRSKPQCCLY